MDYFSDENYAEEDDSGENNVGNGNSVRMQKTQTRRTHSNSRSEWGRKNNTARNPCWDDCPIQSLGSCSCQRSANERNTLPKSLGYVTQDEALFPLLTVEETLTYSSRLRLNAGCNENIDSIVRELLKDLGLEHIAGVRVGSGISGGEKRRLSIGVDLVHDPAVLLLDEPTSGLDSASALHVMSLLKSMALHQRKTIVPHKDDSDDNIVVACVSNQAVEYKKNILYCNSPFREVLILSQRFSSNVFRTKQLFAARTTQALLAGIVLGTIFIDAFGDDSKRKKAQNQIGFFAFSLTFLMSSTTEALPIFLQERRILMRETSRGAYRVSSYVIANTLVFLPFLFLVSLLYAGPVYWLVGLRRDVDGFLYFVLLVWMIVLASNAFVACFSALVPDFITGMSLIAGIMGSFFLFSGYFVSKDAIPKYWNFMQYLSLFKYPFECFMINEFGGEHGRSKCMESFEGECLIYGDRFLMQQGLKEPQKWNNLVMMLSFVLGYRFVGFLILWYKSYRSTN
ncbi:hypothetical protein DH2020_025154 [Rehmannia glutinosa]|uniref:ABC transporter domain-containing protein n=1 Tax=Rehmannia glutinosa TaxID=99300 RepID=A0ABR0W287_REHGL